MVEVARRDLSPQSRSEVGRILSYHLDPEVVSLGDAAAWPDWIRGEDRSDHDQHRGPWHYIDMPLFKGLPPREVPPHGEVLAAINRNVWVLKNGPPQDQAIALSWLAHLVGDIHQPLHTCSLYSPDLPRGDRGGNDFEVRFGHRPINLHSYWDSCGGLFWAGANQNRLAELALHFRSEFSPQPQEDSLEWARESRALAESVAYAGLEPGDRLTFEYIEQARHTSKKRVTLAGYRLASLLNRVFTRIR